MKDSPGKGKPTLESLINDRQVITGKHLIKQQKEVALEAERQKAVLEEAIEFEQRNRRSRARKAWFVGKHDKLLSSI